MIEVRPSPYGTAALTTLLDVVAAAKAGDPLAPATILVPTNYVGVSTRRRLAAGDLGAVTPAGHGIAGIEFLTVYRLAELVGAGSLAGSGRRPVSTPVVAAAVRQVLAAEPGLFTPVAEHPATERSLVRVHRELRDLDEHELDTLADATHRSAEVVRVHRAVEDVLAPRWYDEFDLLSSATRAVEGSTHLAGRLGHVVLYLPQQVGRHAAELLGSVADRSGVTAILGFTGVERTDSLVQQVAARLGGDATTPPVIEPPHADRIISVSDGDDEVRTVVRQIVAALEEGVALERMAVLYGTPDPYARLLDEQLAAAAIERYGDAVRTTAESVVGRTALSLLALPDREFRRLDVFELLANSPIRRSAGSPTLIPVAAWERVARAAGVIAGVEEWHRRLDQYVDDCEHDADRLARLEPDSPRRAALAREASHAADLRDFVSELSEAVTGGAPTPDWRSWSAWLRGMLERYLGPPDDSWPAVEHLAHEQLERAFDRLAGLDEIEPATTLTVFRRTLELELESGLGRVGSMGDGIFVGRVGQALGLDLDRLFVIGMAEGTLPARRRDDSLLPDHERSLVGDALSMRSAESLDEHRLYLAALASTSGERTLLFPRGDLRRSSERVPSRWLLDTASALDHRRHDSETFAAAARDPQCTWATESPSFVAGLRRCTFPPNRQEYDLASLMRHLDDGLPVAGHRLTGESEAFRGGVELITARSSRDFTRFDGNLVGRVTSGGVRADIVAPTRLEDWAACPHRYFMRSVLRVGEVDTPEALLRIAPIERGNVMHEALDLFFAEISETDELPAAGEDFTEVHHRRLDALARDIAGRLEGRGLVGKRIFWERDRRDILNDLHEMLRRDARRERRGRVVGTELGFGVQGATLGPVAHQLPSGRQVRFRGSIDRLEETPGGGLVVIDYKTGGTSRFRGLSQEDPDLAGTKLQLPVYALAGRAAVGRLDAPVHAAYWFITEGRGEWRWIGLDVDQGVMQRFDEVVEVILSGIEGGIFAPRPRERDNPAFVECPYCDPDGLGTSELRTQWMRKRHAPELSEYLALAEPESVLHG